MAFKPRNAILLHWLAERSTGRPGMSNAEIQRLFAPRPATVAAVRSYLSANGLSVVDSTDMSLVVSGTAAAADQAFGVGLQDIHGRARDHVSGAVEERPAAQGDRLGRAVGGGARYVAQAALASTRSRSTPSGRTTSKARSRAARRRRRACPAAVTAAEQHWAASCRATCAERLRPRRPTRTTTAPARSIGFVEFSNYNRQDSLDFKQCFNPTITGTLTNDHKVGGGPTDALRPGRGQPRHRGRHGRRAGRQPGGLQGAEQPRAPADDARARCAPTASTSCRTAGACASCSCRSS